MAAAHLVPEGVTELFERETAIDHRVNPAAIERADEILLLASAPNDKALQPRLLGHQRRRRHLACAACQHPDQRNMPADAHRLDRLGERASAADLDHVVDAVIDSGDCGTEPTTVVDLSGEEPEIVRYGAGDPERFE